MNRREVFAAATVVAPILMATAPPSGGSPAPTIGRVVKPLPFDPTKLKGLSEKLLVSHHDNNYGTAVKNLGKVEETLAGLKPEAPGFVVGGLRARQLLFHNSMALHELYFANLGGDGKQSGPLAKALSSRWEEGFRATALALSGGSGWVTLSLHMGTGELLTALSENHSQTPAAALPLLVCDLYEHSYAMDYGAATAKYVDAFFANIKWEEVERRYEAARGALKALHD